MKPPGATAVTWQSWCCPRKMSASEKIGPRRAALTSGRGHETTSHARAVEPHGGTQYIEARTDFLPRGRTGRCIRRCGLVGFVLCVQTRGGRVVLVGFAETLTRLGESLGKLCSASCTAASSLWAA